MKKSRKAYPDKYTKGYDKELGTRFEAKCKRSKKRRKSEKAGRKAARRGRK